MHQEDYALGEQLIVGDMFVANSIYIDIGFFKYLDLGRIIIHPNITSVIYSDIVDIVKADTFKERYTNDPSILFKDVPNITSVLSKAAVSDDAVFVISPTFDGSNGIIENNLIINDNTRRVLSKNHIDTTIDINISTLPNLSDKICRQIAEEYADTFESPVRLLRKPLSSSDTKYDAYFIDDISVFNETMQQPLNSGRFIQKYVFCQRLLPLAKLSDIPIEALPLYVSRFDMFMTAACKFHFIQPFKTL